ncbi:Ribonuclease III [Methylophaga frappieri]|uniref:Ribonuclease 3 n=1 Tax=Methylophaga frappieri (strain ATCC BAA-2434 / DSM 25690 / JAM7) TaxID=754477 RepID=I1YFA0_METFJ|nr:ribonuclease III [Methylophaga frappieri]AFJ01593.1 Ribonuclease III [Methylophaga frappieri]
MTALKQRQLCEQLNISFSDATLLQQALTHRSADVKNNERLEFLGDAILSLVIAEALYARFTGIKEGKLSRLRAALVRGETLAELGRELALGEVLVLGPGELKSGGFRRESILADAVEAIFGAVYLDKGFAVAKSLILRLYQERLDSIDVNETVKDPKTRLQELLQSRKLPLPIYSVKEIKSDQTQPVFEASCQVGLLDKVVVAQGSSHRKAEKRAAERVLILIEGKV